MPTGSIVTTLMELSQSVKRWNPRVLGMDDDTAGSEVVLHPDQHPTQAAAAWPLHMLSAQDTEHRL